VFLLFVDDLHMDFPADAAHPRDLPQDAEEPDPRRRHVGHGQHRHLVDLSIDLTYDRALLDDAINRISGGGLKPSEIIKGQEGADVPVELRLPRARRVHDREPVDDEPREAAQPPQGRHLGEQRLRLSTRSRSRA